MSKRTPKPSKRRREELRRLNHPSFRPQKKFSIAQNAKIRQLLVKRMGPRAKVLEIGGGMGLSVKDILSQTRGKPSNFVMLDRNYGTTLRTKDDFERGLSREPKLGGDLFHAPFQQKQIFDAVLVRHVVAMMGGLAGSRADALAFRKREKQIEKKLESLGISKRKFGPIITRKLMAMKAITAVLTQYLPRLREKGCIFINAIPFTTNELTSLYTAKFKEAIEVSRVLHQAGNECSIYFFGAELLIVRK